MSSGWQRFRRSRGARLGAGLLATLTMTALAADLIASDLPLACHLDGRWFILPCVTRPAKLSGQDNESLRARATFTLAPLVPYGPEAQHPGGVTEVLSPPTFSHWLGTDDRGRDVLSRLVHGTRTALGLGIFAVTIYLLIGLVVGLASALSPAADLVLGRVIEVGLTFPMVWLLMVVQGLTASSSALEVGLAVALTYWPHIARLVRADALRIVAAPHVEAARAIGASPLRVALVHVLPLATTPLLVNAVFGVAQVVLFESLMSFLGFGVPPPTASWGELLQQAQSSGLRWWLLLAPTSAIAVTVLACNRVGEGVRALVEES